ATGAIAARALRRNRPLKGYRPRASRGKRDRGSVLCRRRAIDGANRRRVRGAQAAGGARRRRSKHWSTACNACKKERSHARWAGLRQCAGGGKSEGSGACERCAADKRSVIHSANSQSQICDENGTYGCRWPLARSAPALSNKYQLIIRYISTFGQRLWASVRQKSPTARHINFVAADRTRLIRTSYRTSTPKRRKRVPHVAKKRAEP